MATISIGDTVRVRGIRSPGMLVIDQAALDEDTLATCLWFDENKVARQIALRASMLEHIAPERSDDIPVFGYVS